MQRKVPADLPLFLVYQYQTGQQWIMLHGCFQKLRLTGTLIFPGVLTAGGQTLNIDSIQTAISLIF